MRIYELAFDYGLPVFIPTRCEAIREAKRMGAIHVIAYEIGKLTKNKACELAQGYDFAERSEVIWISKDKKD